MRCATSVWCLLCFPIALSYHFSSSFPTQLPTYFFPTIHTSVILTFFILTSFILTFFILTFFSRTSIICNRLILDRGKLEKGKNGLNEKVPTFQFTFLKNEKLLERPKSWGEISMGFEEDVPRQNTA